MSSGEFLENVSFTSDFKSRFMNPMKLTFEQSGTERVFDLALAHCSVATLLYHTEFRKFLVVKQFRPAVYLGRVTKFPENKDKSLEDIDYSKYSTKYGYTIELCAGLVDKNIPLKDIAREEIEEECGYTVDVDDIQYLATYTIDADESGSSQYLFYAEISEKNKISEGGGNILEGERISKIWLTEAEARSYLEDHESQGPPGALYAFLWWFNQRNKKLAIENPVDFVFTPDKEAPMENIKLEKNTKSNRYHPLRMTFTMGSLTRNWDLALNEDSVAVYVYNRDTRSILLNLRFRPAVFIGRTLHQKSKDKTCAVETAATVDWKTVPEKLAYTLEMCSTHTKQGEEMNKVIECVRNKLGYNISSAEFVTSFILGISQSGDRQRLYYVEVDEKDRIEGWKGFLDIKRVSVPLRSLHSLFCPPEPIGPPGVMYMTQWFINHKLGTFFK